jgi:tetratricopeptide (TPR) repeat protein
VNLKLSNRHSVLLLLLLAITLPQGVLAQKKKKSDDSPRGIRLREAEFYFTEGEKFFILEDYAKALLYYQRALEINPENGTVHYKIADVLARSNKQDDLVKASISIDNALKLEKTNKYFFLLAANIANSLARFDKAAEYYETMTKEIKGTEEYLYELAAIYQYANKPEEAIKVYNRAEAALGVNEISSTQKMRLYLEAGKTKEAFEEGEKLLTTYPEEERYVMAFAEVLSQKGMKNEAIQYLEKFSSENPDAGNAKMLLAGLYRDVGQEPKARPILMSLFDDSAIEPGSKLIVLGAYNAEISQARNKKIIDADKEAFALNLFEKLKAAHPQDANVHIVGGDIYLSIGKNREAQLEYLKATQLDDVSFEVWENLLYLEINLEQWENVLAHSERALELYPNQSMIHYFNGWGLFRKNRFTEAVASLEQAKRMVGSNAALASDINSLLGDTYNATKEFSKSDKAFEDALSFNPNNEEVLNNYSWHLAQRKENLDKAEKMSSTLIKNNPENPTFLDTHAWVLYLRQKYRDAKRVIEKAISTGKANATHFEHYGDILYQLGDVDGAVKQWEKARGMNAKSEILNKKIANRKIYE